MNLIILFCTAGFALTAILENSVKKGDSAITKMCAVYIFDSKRIGFVKNSFLAVIFGYTHDSLHKVIQH